MECVIFVSAVAERRLSLEDQGPSGQRNRRLRRNLPDGLHPSRFRHGRPHDGPARAHEGFQRELSHEFRLAILISLQVEEISNRRQRSVSASRPSGPPAPRSPFCQRSLIYLHCSPSSSPYLRLYQDFFSGFAHANCISSISCLSDCRKAGVANRASTVCVR